ncbi:MAG: SPFH domain-containing protein [Lachnospiraceae bacterium]|nr:SPFH domain-containing protein [Lachnospiraceae bacterium]
MGIIKAAVASASSMAGDQWKEYFYCSSIPDDIIMLRAAKQTSAHASNEGSADVVTDGSVIAVADGEAAIVVSNGKALAVYTEAGEHIFKSGETSSIFSGGSLKSLGKEFGRRFAFGGEAPAVSQRVYYLNTKEMPGGSYEGTEIPFRILDEDKSIDIDCTLTVSGSYTFRVADPVKIYKQVIGNIERVYRSSYLLGVMKTEVQSIILSSFDTIAGEGMRASQIGEKLPQIEERILELTKDKLFETRGIELVSLAVTALRIREKDSGIVREFQKTAVLRDPDMAAAALATAQQQALTAAASNSGGAVVGVAGVAALQAPVPQEDTPVQETAKFCTECGAKLMGGKFCPECGHSLG